MPRPVPFGKPEQRYRTRNMRRAPAVLGLMAIVASARPIPALVLRGSGAHHDYVKAYRVGSRTISARSQPISVAS
jgi:hypothetical protein